MFNKRVFLILLFIIIIGTVSSVSANDLNQTTALGEDITTDNVVVPQSAGAGLINETKTFTDLYYQINYYGDGEVYLDCNYTFDPNLDTEFKEGISIFRPVTVWGNGYTLNGNNAARIFVIDSGDVILHDIVFINAKSVSDGGAISGDGTCVNCTFINNSAVAYGGAVKGGYYVNCSFTKNTASNGGAASGASLVNCSFTENYATYRGGAAISTMYGSIVNCTFMRNYANLDGGAIYYGSNVETTIRDCTFTENSANVGGAVYFQFEDSVVNCNFTRNKAVWEAGAVRSGTCVNCSFTENSADYAGAIRYGRATNCIFTGNYAIFGGASYESTSMNCTFIRNYADYGGAIYGSFRTGNCTFLGNYAGFGGAIYAGSSAVTDCDFKSNSARNGGATYKIKAINCYFVDNQATENGGAMFGESATDCIFEDNRASGSGNDTYNTVISNSSFVGNVIYFDASAAYDGDGSQNSPYKYLYADRITSGVTAYFEEGTYDFNGTCIISDARLMGKTSRVIINCWISNQYDFIIPQDSYLELYNLQLTNVNILNQATLIAKDVSFGGNDVFDEDNLPEIPSGSGYLDSSCGGVIVCDTPNNIKSTLIIDGCYFQRVYDAFNGGAIAAINSDIFISNTNFMMYSATYKGGAIYCTNSNLKMNNVKFYPYTVSDDEDSTAGRYNDYTSYYGGSLYCENSDVFIFRCDFNSSISFSFGGCIASLNSRVSIEESNFNDSLSLIDGGGAIYSSKSEMRIFDSAFNRNVAEFGGAICNINSVLDSYHSTFSNNFANCYGGSIYDIYGTINLYTNWFYVSHASVGGAIYTRIPNSFNLYSNYFGDCFAEEGSSIFFDGKKESIGSNDNGFIDSLNSAGLEKYNSFANDYHLIAEFRATLNGEEYYLISNPLFYQLSSSQPSYLYLPYSIFEVNDGLASIMIYDRDDYSYVTSIATGNVVRNVSAIVGFSEEFENPVLNFYLIEDINNNAYFNRDSGTYVYSGSRNELFDGRNIVKTYSINLSVMADNNDYYFTLTTNVDFEKSILSIKSDNLYDANSFIPVSLIDNPLNDSSVVSALPSYYNSNDYGYVSSVKDQKNGGNCWAFAGLATLETCLKKATGITYDFSEENAKNLMAAYSVYGIKIETNFAGYDSMIMSYLTSWLGPIDESTEGYDDFSSISVLENPMFHIQNIKFLPVRLDSTDNAFYKMAIRDYGAVSVIFKWGKDYHAVSLVGWDDGYVGKDSLGNDANGAWIFKNSYGEDWENNGFGYLAYSQKISEQIDPGMHAYTFIFNDVNPYDKIYQYDFAGVSQFYHYSGSIYFKNTFTAEDDSLLSAFSTYFDTQTNYTVSVYVNDQFVFAQNGTSSAGYYTISFKNIIQLDKGDKFTIEVHNHNAEGYSCIPVCYAEEITKKTFSANLSFVSLDGETWYDLYDYADSCHVACIKAFTQNINLTSIKISTKEFETINTNNFNVKVSFDDFAVANSINYCLVKFNVDGKIYYAQIKNGVASLNLDLEDGVHNLSAQYKDNVFESNVIQFNFTVDTGKESYCFNAIQDMVNHASDKSAIVLNNDYSYDENFDDGEYGVYIDKQITIDGKGHSINGLSKATAFYIAANNVVLSNIVFDNTFAINGGGLYVAGRNVTLNNCSFINSTATQSGGGIYSLFDLNINDCKFINDSANTGGGLYLMSTGTSNIENSCFVNNFASTHGSAIYVSGVGSALVSTTNFTANSAKYNGGAVFSAVNYNNFTDCDFVNNSARSGGAIFSNAKFIELADCRFLNNSVLESGGAITAHDNINIYNSDFINNSVIDRNPYDYGAFGGYGGGAIYSYHNLNIYDSNFINNTVVTSGGAIFTTEYLNVYRSTFINNSASRSGGAVYNTLWQMFRSNMGITHFTETNYYDCVFIDNKAETGGGAIYSSDLVQNCTFINNSANTGGALCDAKVVNGSRFINNSAQFAAAIYYEGLVPFYCYDSLFIDNHAEKTGGALYFELYENLLAHSDSNAFISNAGFINNSASYGGAIYSECNAAICSSSFTENTAVWGGAIDTYGNITIDSCNFTKNCVNRTGGAVYCNGKCDVVNSCFADNSASSAGGIYTVNGGFISDSIFSNNSVSYSGGALYSAGECSIVNCEFDENSADFGGAVLSDGDEYEVISNINVSSCRFTGNFANVSGGAVYIGDTGIITASMFGENNAYYGGAVYLEDNATCYLRTSSFSNNSAEWGGAIFSNAQSEENMSYADISSCNFTQNCANRSGGAVYFDGKCVITDSSFLENNARRGTTIYSVAYLDLRNSNIKSRQNNDSIFFTYHYYENNESYGDLNLKNNKFDVESVAIFFSEDEHPYKYPLNIVFSNITVTKGQFVLACHLEDEYGNLFFGCGDLNLTLIDQNKNIINLRLKDDFDLGGYFLNTSSIDYAAYNMTGKISAIHPDNYIVHDGSLTVGDGSNRTYVFLASSGLTKTYGNSKKLTVSLKDANGNPIAGSYVYIKLNGKTTKVKTDSEGKASMAVSLVPKTYTATIIYNGSDDCYPAVITAKVVIKKATPKIYASKKTFKLNVKTKKYTVTLKNNKGKVIKYASLKIKVKGVTYYAKTNGKGQATFNIKKLTKKGSFKSTITYSGSKYYNKLTKTVTLTVK